jgi:hypothetical protein
MRTKDEIAAELRAMLAAQPQTRENTRLRNWVNGCIFTLSWLKGEPGAVAPSEGFGICLERLPEDRATEASSRKDPALP